MGGERDEDVVVAAMAGHNLAVTIRRSIVPVAVT
jgi:hypothetical protein